MPEETTIFFSHTDRGGCKRDGSGGAKVLNGNIYLTPDGGFACRFTAGEGMTRGHLLYVNPTGSDGNVWKNPVNGDFPMGTLYDPTAVAGNEVWVTVAGIGYALADTGNAPARGQIVVSSSATRGLGSQSTTVPAITEHVREVGHFIESGVANTPARIILHFN